MWNHDHTKPLKTVVGCEDLATIMDIVATSLDCQSGMLDQDEVDTLRRVAAHLGIDPGLYSTESWEVRQLRKARNQ